ncbi:MAG TPA: Rrf2 family transcriptional regulator [Clostridiales bacterium]|nr:Rrf2 family transcriptional regulator [Clostridiales bacterium]
MIRKELNKCLYYSGRKLEDIMKFQTTTDYAIRIVVYLALHSPKLFSASEAARELGMTHAYFNKIAVSLRKAGFIVSVQGPGGGYKLAKSASDITLYDIVCTIQGEIYINSCLEDDGFCTRFGTNSNLCPVHKVFGMLQENIINILKSQTIESICKMS